MQYHTVMEHVVNKHTHTLRICNSHCFSTTTMAARTCLNVTLYVHWLACFIFERVNHGASKSQAVANETDNFKADRKSFEMTKRVSNYFHEN